MTVEVAGYKYRWFDSMMIVMPVGDDKPLYIYTPSDMWALESEVV